MSLGLALRQEALWITHVSGVEVLRRNTYPSNVAASGPDTTHGNTDSPSRLRNQGTLLQSVINPLNAVIFHTQEETAGQLWAVGPSIEESRRGMSKPLLRK